MAERSDPDYPHGLHLAVANNRNDVDNAASIVMSGSQTGTNDRKKKSVRSANPGVIKEYVEDLNKKYDELSVPMDTAQ